MTGEKETIDLLALFLEKKKVAEVIFIVLLRYNVQVMFSLNQNNLYVMFCI